MFAPMTFLQAQGTNFLSQHSEKFSQSAEYALLPSMSIPRDQNPVSQKKINKEQGAASVSKLLVPNARQVSQQCSPIKRLSAGEPVDLGNGVFLLSDDDDPTSSLLEVKIKTSQWLSLTSGNVNELQNISKLVYSKFSDDFDFIFFVLNTKFDIDIYNYLGNGSNFVVSNNVQGIGRPIFNNSPEWGSNGKLKSAMIFPSSDAILYGPTLNGLCSNWAAYIKPTPYMPDNTPINEDPWINSHWGVSNAGGQLGGFKYVRTVEANSGGVQGKTLYQASMYPDTYPNGSFVYGGFGLDANRNNSVPYSNIELYLMGMKSAQELRNAGFTFDIYSGNEANYDDDYYSFLDGYFYSTKKTSYTIDHIIMLNDIRVPNYSSSQKEFKVLTIAITPENAVETFYEEILGNVGWLAGDMSDNTNEGLYNFRQATENRGSLIVDGIKNSFKLNQSPLLSNIVLSAGTLSPRFNPYAFDFKVRVDASVETIDITGITNMTGVSVIGNVRGFPLKLNDFNDVVIQAKLPNGDVQNYTITVIRGEISPVSFTWDIDQAGQEVSFRLGVAFGELCTIDWGDGSTKETVTGNGELYFDYAHLFTHTYRSSGSFQVKIRGVDDSENPVIALHHNIYENEQEDYRITQVDLRTAHQLLVVDMRFTVNTELDVSMNKRLQSLWWINGKLSNLDISQNTELLSLNCFQNLLTTLDVSQNKKLEVLWCPYNRLTSIDVSNNSLLNYFVCAGNQLTSVDVKSNKKLDFLSVRYLNLKHLDLSNNIALTSLCASFNQFTELDVSHNKELTYLECEINLLTKLDIRNNIKLTWLSCYNNFLSELDLSKNTELTNLHCGNNKLTNLDISNNPALKELMCENNAIPLINLNALVQKTKNIEEVFFAQQTLPEIEVLVNTPIVLDNVFFGVNTSFNGLSGNYTLTNGVITFSTPGEYWIEIFNPAVISFAPLWWGLGIYELPAVIQAVTVVQPVTGVVLNVSETILYVGGMDLLTATVEPFDASNQSITWKLDNPNVVTIEDGVVTALATGTATITVTTEDGKYIATCIIKVVQPVTGVSLNIIETTLMVGEKAQLKASIEPDDATNKAVIWTTDDSSIATVANGVVTAISEGVTFIIVTTEDGEHIAYCIVTVTDIISGTENRFAPDLKIYPNPSTDLVRITGVVDTENYTSIRIINAAGVVVHTQLISNPEEIIHLEHLPKGLYLITIEQNGKTKTLKLIKN